MSAPFATIESLRAAFEANALSPTEALSQCRERIASRNQALNILVHAHWPEAERMARESAARWRAGAPLSDIDGAPILVKANCAVAGLPWTAALKPFAGQIAGEDSQVVALLKSAGAVIVGLANMHEAALGATTTSPLYGPCINPLREAFTPGGSSGGSAAGLAAGFCAGAIGTDTMGSVRIPSAYCGVVGFKPSCGRISTRGVIPLSWTLDHVGLHAGCVADVAALFRVCASFDPQDAYAREFPLAQNLDGRVVRVGVGKTAVILEEPVRSAFESAVLKLRESDVEIVDVDLTNAGFSTMRRQGLLICEAELLAEFPQLAADPSLLSADLARGLDWAGRQSAPRLAGAYMQVAEASLLARRIFDRVDVMLTPTAPHVAFPQNQVAPETQADLTVLANFARLPSLALPIKGAENALPASLQIMGPAGEDVRVLDFAVLAERVLST
jgi:aspartyl-tRNA(Asn)/glutamyl-tRNA(Gln) amidotransferase subunit A